MQGILIQPTTTQSLMKFSYAASAIANEDGWPLSHLGFLSIRALKLTCPILQFTKTWYVVGKSKSPPITACPTFSGPKSQYCSTKWRARYHNSGKKCELQLKTHDACKRNFDVERGFHITRSLQFRHQKSVQNSTSQSIRVLRMHISQSYNLHAVS